MLETWRRIAWNWLAVGLLLTLLPGASLAAGSPWVGEELEYAPGRYGEALRFDWWRSKLFYKAPGYLNPQAGTVQFWIAPLNDIKDLQDYGIVMQAAPTRSVHRFSAMSMGLLPDTDGRCVGSNALIFYVTADKSGHALVKGLNWKKNEWHAVALTWGPRGACVYVDGELVAQDGAKSGAALTEVPDLLSFGGGMLTRYPMPAYSLLDEIEISDCERPVEYIRAFAKATAPSTPDAHTIALHHADQSKSAAGAQMTETLRSAKPYAVSGSDFLGQQRVFAYGTPTDLPVTLVNPGANAVTFLASTEITDFYKQRQTGQTLRMTLTGGTVEELSLNPEIKTPGWYAYTLTVQVEGKEIFRRQESFVVLPKLESGWASAGNFLGHHLTSTHKNDLFTLAGIPWERDMEAMSWPTVEPEKGSFDWRAADYLVAQAKKNSQQLVMVLGYTPRWAGKVSDDRAQWKNQANTYRSRSYPPRDLKEFYNYVFTVVSRYKGTVKHWEIWNEPDWNQPSQEGLGFMGTNAQYQEMLKTGYAAAKAADPECVVLSGGFVPHAHLIDYLVKNDGTRYFDILGMHRYRSWEDYVRYAKQVRKRHWQTEKQLFKAEEIGPEIQLAWQNGAEKYFLFDASKSCFNEWDWNPTPFYFAGAQAAQKIGPRRWSRAIPFTGYGNVIGGSLLDAGKPTQMAALTAFYQGGDELKVSLMAPAGETLVVTDYMGAVTRLKAEAGKPMQVAVRAMTFIEGAFDPASIRVESLAERNLLRNGAFTQLDGDVGIDRLEQMKLREWKLWPEAGTITLVKDEDGNALTFVAKGKGLLRVTQFADQGKSGFYRVSAEFKKEGDEPVTAYLSAWDSEGAKDIAVQTWSNLETGRYKRYSLVVPIGEANRKVSINIGLSGGKGSFTMRRPEMVQTVNPVLAAKTTYIDLKPYANQTLDDEVAGDSKGGWGDLGPGNPSFLKRGERDFGAQLFELISGDVKTTKAVILLGGEKAPALPRVVKDIAIGTKFKELDFLHTALFVTAAKGKTLGTYVVNYAEGTKETIPLVRAQNIDDWYAPGVDPAMKVLEEIVAPNQLRFALFGLKWVNPHPEREIRSIDFTSEGNSVLALFAVSGVKP